MNGEEKALTEIKEELKALRKDVNHLLSYEKFKKEAKENLMKYIRTAVILGSIAMSAIGWLSYETGLYKPIPVSHHEVKK